MRFKQVLSRMRGLSLGLTGVGASWVPPKAEVDIAQEVITFLEDRRVLFNDFAYEIESECIDSSLKIRDFLTNVLRDMANEPGLAQHLRALRAACRRFNDFPRGHHGPSFYVALGELRATFGVHLGLIAAKYGLGLEGDLARILPPPADDDDGGDDE